MRKEEEGFVLLASLFLVLFLGILTAVSLMRADIQMREIELQRASLNAFYVAETGIEMAINELRRDQDWISGFSNVTLQDGSVNASLIGYYTVLPPVPVAAGPTILRINSTGQDAETGVIRRIEADVQVQNPAEYFLSGLFSVNIASGASITDNDGNPATNLANILARDVIFEVNTALPDGPQPSGIERDIWVAGNVEFTRGTRIVVDGANVTSSPDVHLATTPSIHNPVAFVNVDLNRYRGLAQQPVNGGRYESGNFTYAGSIDWGSLATNNGLVFVEGDVHISGTVSESVNIVATGNIYIDGDITCVDGLDSDGVQEQIGLSAFNDVIISQGAPSSLSVDAFVLANGGLFRAEGGALTKGTLDFEGAIAAKGIEGQTNVNLNTYQDRNYVYDTALRIDSEIPFMSFMADIVNWREVI